MLDEDVEEFVWTAVQTHEAVSAVLLWILRSVGRGAFPTDPRRHAEASYEACNLEHVAPGRTAC